MTPAAYVSILQLLLYQSHIGAVFFHSETKDFDQLIGALKLKLPEVCLYNISDDSTGAIVQSASNLSATVLLDLTQNATEFSWPIKLALKQLKKTVVYKLLLERDCEAFVANVNSSEPIKFNRHGKILLCQERKAPSSGRVVVENATTNSIFQLLTSKRKPTRLILDKSIKNGCGRIGFNTTNLEDFLSWLQETHYSRYCQNSCRGTRQPAAELVRVNELIQMCPYCFQCVGCGPLRPPTCFSNRCPSLLEDKNYLMAKSREELYQVTRILFSCIGETVVVIVCGYYFRKHGLYSYKNGHLHVRVVCLSAIFSLALILPTKMLPFISKHYCGLTTLLYHLLTPATLLDTLHLTLTDLNPSGRLSRTDERIMISNYILTILLSMLNLDDNCSTFDGLLIYIQVCYSGLCASFLYYKHRKQIDNLNLKIVFSLANSLALLSTIHDWLMLDSRIIHSYRISGLLMILSACGNILVRSSKRSTIGEMNYEKNVNSIKTVSLQVSKDSKKELEALKNITYDEFIACGKFSI